MDSKLIPYMAVDGIPTFTDSFIVSLFYRMQAEDLVDDTFPEGTVQTADEWLKQMKFGKNSLHIVEHQHEVAGAVWLNGFRMRSAQFNFCFFSNLRGEEAVVAGRHIVDELLNTESNDGDPVFDMLFGITPINNAAALRWCRRCGFGLLGELPCAVYNARKQKSVPGYVHYVERGKYGRNY